MGSWARRLRDLDARAERRWEPALEPYLGVFEGGWAQRVSPRAVAMAFLGYALAEALVVGLPYWLLGVTPTRLAGMLVAFVYWPFVWRFYLARRPRVGTAGRGNGGWIGLAVIVIVLGAFLLL